MKIALIRLPDLLNGIKKPCSNLHGIWEPPKYVLSFSATSAIIEFIDSADFETKKVEILASHKDAVEKYLQEVH